MRNWFLSPKATPVERRTAATEDRSKNSQMLLLWEILAVFLSAPLVNVKLCKGVIGPTVEVKLGMFASRGVEGKFFTNKCLKFLTVGYMLCRLYGYLLGWPFLQFGTKTSP